MRHTSPLTFGLAIAACLVATGCRRKANEYIPPPPPEVTVAQPVVRTLPVTLDLTGVTRAYESIEIRARVRGFIAAKHVEGGERVRQGDLLFTIDPREYEAAVRVAEAQLETVEATLRLATLTLERTETAFAQGAATQQELDIARAEVDSGQAQAELARARLKTARLDLEYTQVRAPIDGRLGIQTPEVGQLVGATDATLLTTVVNDSQIFATYTLDEQQLLMLRRAFANRRPGEDGRPQLTVLLGLADEEGFPHVGRFHKADPGLDPSTGTIAVESIFPNPDGTLVPGLYVRVRALLDEQEAMLLPDVALGTDQTGRYVLVVRDDNTVERRGVRTGPLFDRMRRIEEGLTGQEWVVINGVQLARPGTTVNPIRGRADAPPTDAGNAPATPRSGNADPGPTPGPNTSDRGTPPAPAEPGGQE